MKKISENNNEQLPLWKKPITRWLISLSIIMPIATTILTSFLPNPFKTFTTSNDWIGFFGSYTGAIIGGLITLMVMNTTIENGDRNLEISIDQNEKIQNKNNKIAFCNDIATIVSAFCASIRTLSVNSRLANQLFGEYTHWSDEYTLRKEKLKSYRNMYSSGDKILLQLEEDFKSLEKRLNDSKSHYISALHDVPNSSPLEYLFLLKIKLKDIESAKELIEKTDKLNADIDKYIQPKDNPREIIEDVNQIDYLIDEILVASTEFINTYSKS